MYKSKCTFEKLLNVSSEAPLMSHGIEASNVKAKEPRYLVTVTVCPHCLRAVFQFKADRHIAGSGFANVHRRQTSVYDEVVEGVSGVERVVNFKERSCIHSR